MAKMMVFAEQRDGRMKKVSFEALSAGRRLADASGGTVVAVVVGSGIAALAAECGRFGADSVLVADAPAFAAYATESYRDAMVAAVKAESPAVLLFPASSMGIDLAPRVGARLGGGVVSDVVSLDLKDGVLEAVRPVYAGKALATVTTATGGAVPAMATLRPNAFAAVEAPRAGAAVALAVTAVEPRARVIEVVRAEGGTVDVAEAEIVVSGGRGLKAPEHFALINALAKALGAGVGASRAVVDAGWIDHAHQVGQTGKTVSPKLYIACGISGAIQHLAGMSSSKVIVAINKDADAPIFKHATYGIVGDVFDVLPALTQALEAYKAKNA